MSYLLLPLSSENYAHAVTLYEQAFPVEERRRSDEWIRFYEDKENFSIGSIENATGFVGFLSFWCFVDFVYIEHFATLPSCRGKGIGERILRQFIHDNSTRPIVLEVEPADSELSSRRIAFYERQGFALSSQTYVQPAYQQGGLSVPLCLMCTNSTFLSVNFANVVRTLHTMVYGVNLY